MKSKIKVKVEEIDNGFIVELENRNGIITRTAFCENLEKIMIEVKKFLTRFI